MNNEETATWIGWIHQETHALLEDLNKEVRLQNDIDDPFTKNIIYATGNQHISKISPNEHPQQLEDKLASPLLNGKANIPLPQRVFDRRGKIPPTSREVKDIRGKPPAHSTRNNNTRCQINYDNVPWDGNDTSYLQLPNTRHQTGLEQFSMNDTTDICLCHRCGGEGHIRKYCSVNVHCDFCKSYSHHTSVCRSYANFVRAHLMASSRRTSPAHTSRQAEWIQPTVETERADTVRQQKCDETISESDLIRRRDISEITRKHLERVISAMIPSSTCSSSDLTEKVPTNSLATLWGDKEPEKQVIVNNYYIRDKEEGWKQVKSSEISPNNSRSHTQNKPGEISPNETMMEVTINQTLKTSGKSLMHIKKEHIEVRPKVGPNTIEDRRRFHVEGPEIQNTVPPTTERYSHPPPTRTEGSAETAAMLDCIRQLQLTLKEHVLLKSKQPNIRCPKMQPCSWK